MKGLDFPSRAIPTTNNNNSFESFFWRGRNHPFEKIYPGPFPPKTMKGIKFHKFVGNKCETTRLICRVAVLQMTLDDQP